MIYSLLYSMNNKLALPRLVVPGDIEMQYMYNSPEDMPPVTEFIQLTLALNTSSIFYFLQTQKTDYTPHVEFLRVCT